MGKNTPIKKKKWIFFNYTKKDENFIFLIEKHGYDRNNAYLYLIN